MLRIAGWVALAVAVALAAGVLLPVAPEFLSAKLDAGFGATLHFAVANRGQAGAHLVSTFGPLGFLFYPIYFPTTFWWLFALRAALAAPTCWALAWIGYAGWGSPWGAVVALLGCISLFGSPDVWFLTLPLLPALIELAPRPAPAPLRYALGIAVGLVSMVKFTALLVAVATLVPLAAAALWERRRVPSLVTAAVTSAVLVWAVTGRSGTDWLAYLDWSVREISAGYSSAMQLAPNRQLVLHAVAVSGAVLTAGALLGWWRRRSAGWPVVLALAAAVYLLLKEGFVRADVHVFVTCYGLFVISVLLALLWGPRPWRVVVAAALIGLLPGWLWLHTETAAGPPLLYFGPVFPREAVERLRAAPTALRREALDAAQARELAAIRGSLRLPPVNGPIDSYSWDQSMLIAYGVDFQPRPVFQSYMAYSPRLAHANADVLLGDRAPEWILFRSAPIDAGFPMLDDAASWPLLLTRYRVAQDLGGYVLLQRRRTPLAWRLEPIERVTSRTETTIAVPSAAGGPIWARIDLHETKRDAIVRTVFAAPLVFVDLQGREAYHYRLVPALARDGFLLSPLVTTPAEFVHLATQQYGLLDARAVTSLRVQVREALGIVPGPRQLDVEFLRLVIEPPPVEPAGDTAAADR